MPEAQSDSPVRAVSLVNLRAMCEYASSIGGSESFSIGRISHNRVVVEYEWHHMDEQGGWDGWRIVKVSLPVLNTSYPWGLDNPLVAFHIRLVTGDKNDLYDVSQVFEILFDAPKMWRDEDGVWVPEPAKQEPETYDQQKMLDELSNRVGQQEG